MIKVGDRVWANINDAYDFPRPGTVFQIIDRAGSMLLTSPYYDVHIDGGDLFRVTGWQVEPFSILELVAEAAQ